MTEIGLTPGSGYRQLDTIAALLESLKADAPVSQVLVGAFWTAVVLDTTPLRCGLASTVRSERHEDVPPVAEAGHLADRTARELAEMLRSPRTLEASIGLAAFNALLDVDEASCQEINAAQIILERGTGHRVAIVGHFPFVERVRRKAAACWVLELHPHPGDLPAEQAADVLPLADVVAMTGTSLINHTFDGLIQLCRPEAFVILLGGTAPLSPVLLDHRVDAVAGTRVIDVPAALQAIGQGATFPQIPGKRLLTLMREAQTAVAHVVAVCASAQRADPKVDLGEGELVAGYGLLGDAHAGLSERQVSLLALESIDRANREHGIAAVPGSFAENLTTCGLALASLHIGDRLRVGPALLEVVQIGKPPEIAHTYSYQGVSILPHEGVFCRVVEGGRVAHGATIEVIRGDGG